MEEWILFLAAGGRIPCARSRLRHDSSNTFMKKKSCLSADGLPDPARLGALHYAPLLNEYYATGDFVAKAFAVGKTVKRQN